LPRAKTVGEYLKELRENKKGRPSQVREALDVYIDLWENAIKNGKVEREDEIADAVAKVDASGGLYHAAGHGEVSA